MHRAERIERADAGTSEAVEALLAPLARRRVVYSCGVGASDPASVPRLLSRLSRQGDILELRLHDFFPVSPSWNLLDSDGVHRGVPPATSLDPAHICARLEGRPQLSLADWRRLWRPVVARADRIVAYSTSTARLFDQAYPSAARRTQIVPHRLSSLP